MPCDAAILSEVQDAEKEAGSEAKDAEADEFLDAIMPPVQKSTELSPLEDLLDGLDI